MDKVFDSVNGASIYPRNGKPLRCAVKNGSVHVYLFGMMPSTSLTA